jgi:hypothetical protein
MSGQGLILRGSAARIRVGDAQTGTRAQTTVTGTVSLISCRTEEVRCGSAGPVTTTVRGAAPPRRGWVRRSSTTSLFENHVADHTLLGLGKLLDPVAKAVVRNHACAQLPRKRQDEIVGVGSSRCLPQRRVGHDDRLEPVINELVAKR